MVTALVTESAPLCYGIACPDHANCKRYTDVDGSDALHYVSTCQDGGGERPWFIPIRSQQEQPA